MRSGSAAPVATSRRRRTATVWGDGFVDDDPLGFGSARTWEGCSPDEYILFHPRLVASGAPLATVLQEHLEHCVAVRAVRLASIDRTRAVPALRSTLPAPVAADHHAEAWFSDGSIAERALKRIGLGSMPSVRLDAERALLIVLDGLLASVQRQEVPVACDKSECLLAFGAGIHPAYLWPGAAITHSRGVTAGWLGHLDRGRAAFMPALVAEYVLDCLTQGVSYDARMADLAGSADNLHRLRRAAIRRERGDNPIVRLAPGTFRPDTGSADARVTLLQEVSA